MQECVSKSCTVLVYYNCNNISYKKEISTKKENFSIMEEVCKTIFFKEIGNDPHVITS